MWEDTIVEEVHAIREQLLAQFGGDLHKYCEYVRTHPVKGVEPDKTAPIQQGINDTAPNTPTGLKAG